MFNLQDLMDPVYYPMTKAVDSFSFQMSLKNKPDEMKWADPFRHDDVVPPHVKQAVVESQMCIRDRDGPAGDSFYQCGIRRPADNSAFQRKKTEGDGRCGN